MNDTAKQKDSQVQKTSTYQWIKGRRGHDRCKGLTDSNR